MGVREHTFLKGCKFKMKKKEKNHLCDQKTPSEPFSKSALFKVIRGREIMSYLWLLIVLFAL